MTKPRRLTVVVTILFGLGLASAACPSVQAEETLRQRVDHLVQPYLENEIVVGMTIGVIDKGQEEFFGYGRMGKEDKRVPDGDTVYEIGSVSKVFTGLLLADAVAQGRVKLDQAAGELLPPDVSMPKHENRVITLQDLSTHVSGLPRLPDNLRPTDPSNPYANYTVDEMYAFLNRHKLRRAPGEKSEYSNLGVGLLGALLARDQKSTYEKLLIDRITTPLKMADTSITLNTGQQSKLATPHRRDGQPATNWDLPALAGAGAIRSTARDMLRFAKANLAPPAGAVGEAIELAWKVHQPPIAPRNSAMGLGWTAARKGNMRFHNGETGGYHSIVFVDRDHEAGVVLLANTANGDVDKLGKDIMRMVGGAKVKPRVFAKAIAVAPKIMQRYVGNYQLIPGIVFTVTLKDGKLMVQLTGQPAFQVYARSETEWYYKIVPATLTFEVDDEGNCSSLELFQNGVRQKAKRY